jgi:hypothetical protein
MDSWDFLAGDDASPLEAAAAERALWPAEIAALHVIVPGAQMFPEPMNDGFILRYFADEDPGAVHRAGDCEDDLWVLLERQHYVAAAADE